MENQMFNVLVMAHLIVLSMWGGVVATEAVIELYPFRHPELHPATIRFHYWIDLLVELPLVLGVLATGVALLLSVNPVTPLHLVLIGFGGAAVAINLFCIVVVVKRGRRLKLSADDGPLWRASRIVLACFATGILCAGGAALLGFRFALERLG